MWTLLFFASFVIKTSVSQTVLVDLSYTFDQRTPNHPHLSKFDLRVVTRGTRKHGYWMELSDFCASEHSGTHIDAPSHFKRGGKTVDKIRLENLYRVPGVVMDFTETVRFDTNYEIKPSDLDEWVRTHGLLPDGCVLLLRTGWAEKAFQGGDYAGLDGFGKTNFPGLGQESAEWIVNYKNRTNQQRGIYGVGVDLLSLDVGQSLQMPAHLTILGNGLFGIENLSNMHKLPNKGFTLTILPMKIGKGSGAPARVVAEIGGVQAERLQIAGFSGGGGVKTQVSLPMFIFVLLTLFCAK